MAAPYAPNFFIRIKFKIVLMIAPNITDIVIVFVSFIALNTPVINNNKELYNTDNNKGGIYIQAKLKSFEQKKLEIGRFSIIKLEHNMIKNKFIIVYVKPKKPSESSLS